MLAKWKLVLFAMVGWSAMMLSACGPDYPKCDNSEDCAESEKGQEEGRLICVNGVCQQCAADADCGDPAMECNAGMCERIAGYCTAAGDCAPGEKCENNRCKPECAADTDCPEGQECQGGRCVEKAECQVDADCPDGETCRGGRCVEEQASACTLETVYFGYDESVLTSEARTALSDNAECIKNRNLDVLIEGHADERGTPEYNIALGERRARSAADYLKSLGVNKKSIDTISYGEERLARQCGETGPDSCHRQNRRVVFETR